MPPVFYKKNVSCRDKRDSQLLYIANIWPWSGKRIRRPQDTLAKQYFLGMLTSNSSRFTSSNLQSLHFESTKRQLLFSSFTNIATFFLIFLGNLLLKIQKLFKICFPALVCSYSCDIDCMRKVAAWKLFLFTGRNWFLDYNYAGFHCRYLLSFLLWAQLLSFLTCTSLHNFVIYFCKTIWRGSYLGSFLTRWELKVLDSWLINLVDFNPNFYNNLSYDFCKVLTTDGCLLLDHQ